MAADRSAASTGLELLRFDGCRVFEFAVGRTEARLRVEVDVLPGHARYVAPPAAATGWLRTGELRFLGADAIEFEDHAVTPIHGRDLRLDRGFLHQVTSTSGGWRVEGEFGSLDVRGGSVDVDVDPMQDMVDYSADPALAGFWMQDSYVLAYEIGARHVRIRAEIVLLVAHPRYEVPPPDHALCWRPGTIAFESVDCIEFEDRHYRWYVEPDGGVYYGDIDQFRITNDGWYVDADFGELTVHGGTLTVTLDGDD